MQVHDDVSDLSRVFKLSAQELVLIESELPSFMAKKMADKFVEENWPKVKANKSLMKNVQGLVLEQSAAKITELIVQKVSEALDPPHKKRNKV